MLKHIALLFSILIWGASTLEGQASASRMTREDYIESYHEWAVANMKRTGIPASITLAQGMLESGNGNSRLAREANNHFGIKCHDWSGKRVYHHDDRRNECFRKYKTVYESYADHSEFLSTRSRYAPLFDLKSNDYKGWAKGLKKAGYATDPNYHQRLITIIEENRLYLFDEEGGGERWQRGSSPGVSGIAAGTLVVNPFIRHEVDYNNGVKYVRVKEGDTFDGIAREFNLRTWEVPHYNDLPDNANVSGYDYLYLEAKRNRAHRDHQYHVVKTGQTMHDISQMYGIRLKKLYSLNRMEQGTQPEAGEKLNLRKRVKR